MSLNSALLAGTSGLIANSNALAAISDNIANVNTTAYKRTDAMFDPLVTADNTASGYSAGGVSSGTRQLVSQQGILEPSSSSTDIAISGAGFFVVSPSAEDLGPNDDYLFTRTGSFEPDESGNLRNSAGHYLQGWPVENDTVVANPSDLTALQTVNIGAIGGTAEATTRLQFNANLDANQANFDGAYAAGSMAAYNVDTTAAGAVQPDFETSVQVFDSLGRLHALTFAYKRGATTDPANTWNMEVYFEDPAVLDDPALNGLVMSGQVRFDANGEFDPANSTIPNPPVVDIAAPGGGGVAWAPGLGLEDQSITLELGGPGSTGGLTQLNSESTIISTSVNGSTFGDLAGVEIDSDGFVLAKFNNGVIKPVYQIPVATFQNPNGLDRESGGAYRVSNDSGQFTMKRPGIGGAGTISPQTLESSNVDLATEFTDLIATQQAYSAASQIVTTADEMMDEVIRMAR